MIVKMNGVESFVVTAGYGSIDSSHISPHTGIDLAMPMGTDIYSPISGYVHIVDYGNANIGKGILLKMEDGQQLVFGHLSKFCVQDGQYVNLGQKIAESGNSGNSDGAHLHFGLIDKSGNYADPSYFEHMFQEVERLFKQASEAIPATNLSPPLQTDDVSFTEAVKAIGQFFKDMHEQGIFYAMFHKTLAGVQMDFSKWLLKTFLNYNDAIFFIPAILAFLLTCAIGKNKTTKWIVPMIFMFFVTQCLKYYLQAQ